MTAFVVDASMAAAWVLSDERGASTDALLDQVEAAGGAVPSLFWHEIRNVLLKVERRGRSQPAATDAALHKLRRLRLDVADDLDDATVLRLGRTHSLSSYDASYLGLALSLALPLATADRRLTNGAEAAGVTVLGPYARSAP